jgi:hypothetical protein
MFAFLGAFKVPVVHPTSESRTKGSSFFHLKETKALSEAQWLIHYLSHFARQLHVQGHSELSRRFMQRVAAALSPLVGVVCV